MGDFAITQETPRLLFAYGTLAPDGPEAEARGGWSADSVQGRLFDLGPYPTLVDLGDPTADWIEGFVRPVEESELRERLDPYEGVHEGLYLRSIAVTRSGRVAWVYTYARPLPGNVRGPLVRWNGPRNVLEPGPASENLEDGLHDRSGIDSAS